MFMLWGQMSSDRRLFAFWNNPITYTPHPRQSVLQISRPVSKCIGLENIARITDDFNCPQYINIIQPVTLIRKTHVSWGDSRENKTPKNEKPGQKTPFYARPTGAIFRSKHLFWAERSSGKVKNPLAGYILEAAWCTDMHV